MPGKQEMLINVECVDAKVLLKSKCSSVGAPRLLLSYCRSVCVCSVRYITAVWLVWSCRVNMLHCSVIHKSQWLRKESYSCSTVGIYHTSERMRMLHPYMQSSCKHLPCSSLPWDAFGHLFWKLFRVTLISVAGHIKATYHQWNWKSAQNVLLASQKKVLLLFLPSCLQSDVTLKLLLSLQWQCKSLPVLPGLNC